MTTKKDKKTKNKSDFGLHKGITKDGDCAVCGYPMRSAQKKQTEMDQDQEPQKGENEMGPYCKFCGTRCFTHLPAETPKEITEAYGTSTIVATCPAGQAFEKQKIGYCYDDIMKAIAEAKETQDQAPKATTNLGGEILAIIAFYQDQLHPRIKQALLDAIAATNQDQLQAPSRPAISINKKVIEVRYPNPLFPSIIMIIQIEKEGMQIKQDERVAIMTMASEAFDRINAVNRKDQEQEL